ncbi:MAG TPA: proline--tRNA ligase, partial [Casimicrobiaceae bacterium]|nr:proline--tRNA ligase [Casimicrobiaceae bacterium]
MQVSKFYLNTLKEAPAEADVMSQQLMLRAGLIKKVSSGIYSWLPLGLITLRKVEQVIREEMNRAGALESYLPHVLPAELWEETGRWDKFGPQLLKIRDRQGRDFLFGPTHEEVVTDIIRKDVRSYRQLPVNLYQIQAKFRDEIRPRFGVMRGREFLMKDAYSFDVDRDGLMRSYRAMYDAYARIFTRLGLQFRAVDADTGAIGGFASHEFQVLADSGEDAIAYSDGSDYAANVEQAEALAPSTPRAAPTEEMERVPTPGQSTCADVAKLLGLPLTRTVKCLLVYANDRVHMLLVRGDHMGNEVKIGKVGGLEGWRFATETEIIAATGCRPGYLGPVGIAATIPLIVDRQVAAMSDFVCGANEADYHLRGVNFGRDCREPDTIADIRSVVAG